MPDVIDIAVIGGGAAGLMAAIWAGRASRADHAGARLPRIVVFDGARRLGAKILVAGGGRCNVTHDVVDESAFAGSTRHSIRKVLRRFDVGQTIEFFRATGVELEREETGKLFPTTDNAKSVLNALLDAASEAGVELLHPWRVHAIKKAGDVFVIERSTDGLELQARVVILATGGRSLPKTGSDGHGYLMANAIGHSLTPRIFPALVPLTLPQQHFICHLSGVSTRAALEVRNGNGKRIATFIDSMLCTHFGLSGPVVLDISRYFTDARMSDPAAQLVINWLPGQSTETVDASLQRLGKISPARWLREFEDYNLPDRLARALCEVAELDPSAPAQLLTRQQRRLLANAITNMTLPITNDRGFAHAEVTAGGVPLGELKLETMESRVCPNLFIIGEICDVDGRIGGYNFQWAWASGYVAGCAAASRWRERTNPEHFAARH